MNTSKMKRIRVLLAVCGLSNHELFVARKKAGQWKLSRYAFSSTLPAAK